MDSICPLKYVDCIASRDNVYINLQKDKSVPATNWDMNEKKLWQPFLT